MHERNFKTKFVFAFLRRVPKIQKIKFMKIYFHTEITSASSVSVSCRQTYLFLWDTSVFFFAIFFCQHENCFLLVKMNILCLFNIDFQLKTRMIILGVENFCAVVYLFDIPTFFYNMISILNMKFFNRHGF